ncbi:hypothetical protein F4821DRAFT_248833 [Hypoxylon rubiginosum]|uniref:Uncharacterized protein n=1 Tax=Hypoxylon rubiginosum TaxID=110542 RepID=A0ACC0CMR6_9PEZI|nr:hypothetical protein F4821DRAFT_248833 [Hypoxylon rubiginosum]
MERRYIRLSRVAREYIIIVANQKLNSFSHIPVVDTPFPLFKPQVLIFEAFNMLRTVAVALLASGCLADGVNITMESDLYVAPGRAHRLAARAPRDFGTANLDCKGAEAACNNACYYIHCSAASDPDANKLTYTGPKATTGKKDRKQNRFDSGCQAQQPVPGRSDTTVSVCQSFPYSMGFIPADQRANAGYWQCDEWPPAAHQQTPFGTPGRLANSLRCMPAAENEGLGRQLGQFFQGIGKYKDDPDRKQTGSMVRDDYARVNLDISQADQSKTPYCVKRATNDHDCTQDGYQFGLTKKPNVKGKISNPIDPQGADNHYATLDDAYADLYQCRVSLTREGDRKFGTVTLYDWEKQQHKIDDGCSVEAATGTCLLQGLPLDLQVYKTGNLGSKIGFTYGPGLGTSNINSFDWDTESQGNGKSPSGANRQYCDVGKVTSNKQTVDCYFPCYEHADGK